MLPRLRGAADGEQFPRLKRRRRRLVATSMAGCRCKRVEVFWTSTQNFGPQLSRNRLVNDAVIQHSIPGAGEEPRAGRRESGDQRSSPRGLCRPIEDDGDRLLGAATLVRNGEKPLSVRRHREVAPRRPLGHGEERRGRSELQYRRRPDRHRDERPVVGEIEELPSGRVPPWKTPSSCRYA